MPKNKSTELLDNKKACHDVGMCRTYMPDDSSAREYKASENEDNEWGFISATLQLIGSQSTKEAERQYLMLNKEASRKRFVRTAVNQSWLNQSTLADASLDAGFVSTLDRRRLPRLYLLCLRSRLRATMTGTDDLVTR